ITNMYKILIEDETDNTVNVKAGMGKTSFLFNALKSNEVDGYLEFTGTVLGELTKETPKSTTEKDVYNQANDSLEKKFDTQLLEPMKYNNTYALAVKEEYAKKHNLKTISDLKKVEDRSEEHTSELQSRFDLVCRLLLEKKNNLKIRIH